MSTPPPHPDPQSQGSVPLTEVVAVLGVPFAKVSQAETIQAIENMIAARKPHYLATGNVDFLLQAWKDLELRRILYEADLVVCDSMPVVWISRLLGNPLPERVAGSDLVPSLLKVAAQKNYRVFFLGGRPDVGERAMENIRRDYPSIEHLFYYSPPNTPVLEMDHETINGKIREAKPDMIFVSFGCPKQEKWIAMNYRQCGVPMAVGVGATIDFLAGNVRRAPKWMQASGLEWLYRLCQEPKRLLKRYAMGILFFFIYIPRQILGLSTLTRPEGTEATPTPDVEPKSTAQFNELALPERFDAQAVAEASRETPLATDRSLLCDGSQVEFIDSTGIGDLIQKNKLLRKNQLSLVLVAPSPALVRSLQLMKLTDYFSQAQSREAAIASLQQTQDATRGKLKVAHQATISEFVWEGEVTAQTTDAMWQAIVDSLPQNPDQAQQIVVDMSKVTFVDSTGIGLMVRIKKRATDSGGSVRFTELPEAVKNVLQHTNMTEFLIGRP